jgi:hypothetical protein
MSISQSLHDGGCLYLYKLGDNQYVGQGRDVIVLPFALFMELSFMFMWLMGIFLMPSSV